MYTIQSLSEMITQFFVFNLDSCNYHSEFPCVIIHQPWKEIIKLRIQIIIVFIETRNFCSRLCCVVMKSNELIMQ